MQIETFTAIFDIGLKIKTALDKADNALALFKVSVA
jgi:hypothetical protein